MSTLLKEFDCALLDLDGTVFRGQQPTDGSVETLGAIEVRTLFVTHNASKGLGEVAEKLVAMGFAAKPEAALWVAADVDPTLPSELGLLPGNGSMVAALETATDQRPQVAGKPQPPLLLDALARDRFERPLVVGDRLDTDISGANATGLPSLLMLTGVSTAADMVHADAAGRPTFGAADLRSLLADGDTLRIGRHPAWRVEVGADEATVHSTGDDAGDPLSGVRAVASTVWGSSLEGRACDVVGADDAARQALERYSLARVTDRLA